MSSKARNPNKKLKRESSNDTKSREWIEIYQELNSSQNGIEDGKSNKLNEKRSHSGRGISERKDNNGFKNEQKASLGRKNEEKSIERFRKEDTSSDEETEEFKSKVTKNEIQLLKQSAKFSFGNYDKYYNYRFEERWRDPRVMRFRKDYFLNKDCLDIGCNDGSMTIMVAIKYFPRKIMGIDIDYTLINKCVSNLRYFERQQSLCKPKREEKQEELILPKGGDAVVNANMNLQENKVKALLEKLKQLPKSFEVSMGLPSSFLRSGLDSKVSLINSNSIIKEMELEKNNTENENSEERASDVIGNAESKEPVSDPKPNAEAGNPESASLQAAEKTGDSIVSQEERPEEGVTKKVRKPSSLVIENRFPNNISFKNENFIKEAESAEKFDTIMCLSVTKWIHLNWGDEGIKRLFKKIHGCLKDEGILILEPQDWKSYKKKKCLTEEFKENYKKIKLRPKEFEDYLKIKLGFVLIEKMVPDPNDFKGGFKRNVYVFQKSKEAETEKT